MRGLRLELWLSFALCSAAIVTLTTPSKTQSQTTSPAPPAILLGTAWYPEQWPESRWDAAVRYLVATDQKLKNQK